MPVNDMEGMGLFERIPEQLDKEILYSEEDGYLKKGGIALLGQGVIPSGQVMTADETTGKWIKYDNAADVNEQQTLTLGATPTGGALTITWTPPAENAPSGAGPFTSAAIDGTANITAAEVQTALRTIPGLEAVTVSGSTGGPFTITFLGAVAGQNVGLLAEGTNTLTPTTTTAFATTVAGVRGGQVADAILARAVDTTVRDQACNLYFSGVFKTAALVGMDANALTDLGAKVNTQYGFTRIP